MVITTDSSQPNIPKKDSDNVQENKIIKKDGRTYTLSMPQRFNRLRQIVSMLFWNPLNAAENAAKISQWWKEFRHGTESRLDKVVEDDSPLQKAENIEIKTEQTKIICDISTSIICDISTSALKIENPLSDSVKKEKKNSDLEKEEKFESSASNDSFDSETHDHKDEKEAIEKGTAILHVSEKIENANQEIVLKIESKKKFPVETLNESKKEIVKEPVKETVKEEKETVKEEKETVKEEVVKEPVKETVKEPVKETVKEETITVKEVVTEESESGKDILLIEESKTEIERIEKLKTITSVINNENVKSWLSIAEQNPRLSKTDFYKNLKAITDELNNKDSINEEQIIAQYAVYEAKILAIKDTLTGDHFAKLIQQQEDEFVFNFLKDNLKNNKLDIHSMVNSLKKSTHGKFKENLQSLLNLISTPSSIPSPSLSPLTEDSLEKSVKLNESAVEAVLKDLDPAKAFADFEVQINEGNNRQAKDAFVALTEIFKAGATEKNIRSKLIAYNNAEAVIQKAIIDLAKPLEDIIQESLRAQLSTTTLETLNTIFKSINNIDIDKKPFLKNLLIQNTHHVAKAYLLLDEQKKTRISSELSPTIAAAIYNLKTYLGAEEKERLNFVIDLGKQVLANPKEAFNQYLETQEVLRFTESPPTDSLSVEKFLKTIDDYLDKKTYKAEELLALEAFTSVALYSYIINPKTKIDSSFQPIAEILTRIRAKIEIKSNEGSMKADIEELRKSEQNQNFYKFLKENIENTPTYPKDFWLDPKAIGKMTIADPLLRIIGDKIASTSTDLNESAQLVHKNDLIGYEIYFYPSESENEKPKLLLFLTKSSASSTLQGMNHQLGLFGDPTILQSAQDVISNIISTDILEGYQQDLVEGNLDIIASGFDNSGAAASIVANKLALVYPKTTVTSISAGSTTIVTTEDAYNLNRTKNCFSIRLKYLQDANVDRTIAHLVGDFSENSYHTFPLLVQYNRNAFDINKHNKDEYGNVDNFIPAMKNPIILRGLYQEISDHIIYTETDSETAPATALLTESSLATSFFASAIVVATPESKLYIGQLDDLIALGADIREDIEKYNDAFLKLDHQKLSTSDKSLQLQNFDKERKTLENQTQEKSNGWGIFNWGAKPQTVPVAQKNVLTVEEQENTIHALQQTISYLNNPDVMNLITPEKAISLLVAADTLLVNYTKINTNVGKLPQLVDLVSELRELANKRLEVLYQDANTKEAVSKLLKKEGANLEVLATRVLDLNTQYEDLFGEKKDVLGKIDYEDRFLEYLGFKIAVKGQEDKLGSEPYVARLETNNSEHYDISLFTPEETNKKQRIVINCNGPDALGTHQLMVGNFGAADAAIISRAENLRKLISSQLKQQFAQNQFNASNVDIVITGFGSEGAVATTLGYFLSKEFEKQGCQVQSVGFGAPRFTTQEGANRIRSQQNFVPLRFLSPADTRFEWKATTLGDLSLSNDTYYTIPLQFRIVGAFEIGGHNTNLYGDIQGIKTSMKTAYQMREVAHEKEKLSILKENDNIAKDTTIKKAPISRINLDTRNALLVDFSQKSVEDLKKVEPGKLIRIMKYCIELSESDTLSDKDKELIKSFFSTFIKAIKNDDINETHLIHNDFYKKMTAHGYKANQLFAGKWKIQQIISEDLEKAMEAVKDKDNKLDEKTKEELILRRDYYRGILAGDLNGNRYKPAGGGVNGAVFFRHLESGLNKSNALLPDEKTSKPFLGVFKPHPETVRNFKGWFDMGQWGERIKAVAGMDAHLNKHDLNKRVNNEIFAYELFHTFGFKPYIGFPTTLKFINKNDSEQRPASFCAFIPGFDIVALHVKEVSKKEAKSNTLDKKRTYTDEELHIWQMSKIFDFLTGNMDGHEGNAFVKVNTAGQVIGAVNFDYDKAFASDRPKKIGNQYKWADLIISQQNITAATKEALTKMFTEPDLEANIQAFLKTARGGDIDNFTAEQEKNFRDRIAVLQKIASGEIKQLSELKDYK